MARILVAGTSNWKDYMEFIRKMSIVVQDCKFFLPDDKELVFVHRKAIGSVDGMVSEWIGKTEKLARQAGYLFKDEIFRPRDKLMEAYELADSSLSYAIIFQGPGRLDPQLELLMSALKESEVPLQIVRP